MNADDQIKTSKFLYRFAWAIEIIAASIALSIAWFQILDAPGSASIAEKYMAALPFIAVMLVELTKIPFSRVFYTVQSFKWKIIFATGLALAMVITFETFALGFERFQSITTREIVELQTKITEQQMIVDEHEKQQEFFEEAQNTRENDSKEHQAQVDRINTQFNKSREILDSRKKAIFERNTLLKSANIELNSLDEQIKILINEKNNEIKRLEQAQSAQIKQLNTSNETRLNSAERQISNLIKQQEQIRQQNQNRRNGLNEIIKNSIFTAKYDRQIEEINSNEQIEIKRIQDQIDNLQSSSNTTMQISSVSNSTLEKINQIKIEFDKKISTLRTEKKGKEKEAVAQSTMRSDADTKELKEIEVKLTNNENRRQKALNDLNDTYEGTQKKYLTAQEKREISVEQRDEAQSMLRPLCVDLDGKVNKNQIYRIAMQVYGKRNACELRESELSMVKTIWFGSIALVVSGLGTLTAFGSFILQSPPTSKSSRPLFYYFRRIAYGIRKKLKEPRIVKKEVIKEVPVDRIQIKEVEKEVVVEKVKIQEVPVPEVRYVREEVKVPVVEKEYVHVPVYTDDPTKVEWSKKSKKK